MPAVCVLCYFLGSDADRHPQSSHSCGSSAAGRTRSGSHYTWGDADRHPQCSHSFGSSAAGRTRSGSLWPAPMHLLFYEITALGLRHVGYDTPIELFIPFLWACVEVVSTACLDGEMIVSFRWPLGLVAMVMQRTITEGSTIKMKAIDTYSVEQLREAIHYAADHHRGLDDRGEGHRHEQRRATAGGVPMRAPRRARALDVEGPGRHAEHHAALLVRQERGARVRLCHHLRLPNLPGGPRQVLLRSGRALRAALGHRQDAL